ncbi:hypothetical protein Lsed01_02501 [Demequina sediminis]|uniref:Uncharacterized protein n=1 Tax=Demequina sediminis TaxID=1930058 RepID=A0ABP9WJW3_9MICO|nr:DUF6308 family protein [Demequina sediminis]BDZ61103.1 hypothetical protein GCM10025873_08940 [Demequina sediminis]
MFLELSEPSSTPTAGEYAAARETTLSALAANKLTAYYRASGDYAGTTFRTLGVNAGDHVGPDDLSAITLLGVDVSPRGVRTLQGDNPLSDAVRATLSAIAPGADLRTATASDLNAAWELHAAIKAAIADPTTKGDSNPWVTAAKISARKRPSLIPVRDRVVGNLLGDRALQSAFVYWQLMRALLLDAEVVGALDGARARIAADAAGDLQNDFGREPDLRILDAALWVRAAR